MNMQRWLIVIATGIGLTLGIAPSAYAQAPATKPNILVIWGDDIGYWNVSAYNQGMMGYKTPNIDRLANEGAKFTDYYGQRSRQSCQAQVAGSTPRRPAILTRRSPD